MYIICTEHSFVNILLPVAGLVIIHLEDILMAKVTQIAQITNAKLIRNLFPPRKRNTHKGSYGRVLLLCGSEGMTGAARLAAKGALRAGSGLVYLGVPEKVYPIVAANAGSELVFPLPCDEQGRLSLAAASA